MHKTKMPRLYFPAITVLTGLAIIIFAVNSTSNIALLSQAKESSSKAKPASLPSIKYLVVALTADNKLDRYYFADKVPSGYINNPKTDVFKAKFGRTAVAPVGVFTNTIVKEDFSAAGKKSSSNRSDTSILKNAVFSVPANENSISIVDKNGKTITTLNDLRKSAVANKGAVGSLSSSSTVKHTVLFKNKDNRPSDKALDIVFYPAGFNSADFPLFLQTVEKMKNTIINGHFFSSNMHRINLVRVDEYEEGCPELCSIYVNGPMNYQLSRDRLATIPSDRVVYVYNMQPGAVAMLNGDVYLGMMNYSDVLLHELGHGLGGIMDEFAYWWISGDYPAGRNCRATCSDFGEYEESCTKECTGTNLYRSKEKSIMHGDMFSTYSKLSLKMLNDETEKFAPANWSSTTPSPTPTKVPTSTPTIPTITPTPVVTPSLTPSSTANVAGLLTYPINGSTITSTTQAFTWSKGNNVSQYRFLAGQSGYGDSTLSNQNLASSNTSAVVSNIPANGKKLYITLRTVYTSGSFEDKFYFYETILKTTPTPTLTPSPTVTSVPTIVSPTPPMTPTPIATPSLPDQNSGGAQLYSPISLSEISRTTYQFQWNAVSNVKAYNLKFGKSIGSSELGLKETSSSTKKDVDMASILSGMQTGSYVHVTLVTKFKNGTSINNYYAYKVK